jgi:hypothetical protein
MHIRNFVSYLCSSGLAGWSKDRCNADTVSTFIVFVCENGLDLSVSHGCRDRKKCLFVCVDAGLYGCIRAAETMKLKILKLMEYTVARTYSQNHDNNRNNKIIALGVPRYEQFCSSCFGPLPLKAYLIRPNMFRLFRKSFGGYVKIVHADLPRARVCGERVCMRASPTGRPISDA